MSALTHFRSTLLSFPSAYAMSVLVLLGGADIYVDYRSTQDAAFERLEALATVVARDLSGSLKAVDGVLQDAGNRAKTLPRSTADRSLQAFLKRQILSSPVLDALSLTDADGIVRVSTQTQSIGADVSHRLFVIEPRSASDSDRLFISGPHQSADGKVTELFASRARPARREGWDGVVVASLRPAYFAQRLQTVQPMPGGFAALLSGASPAAGREPKPGIYVGQPLGEDVDLAGFLESGQPMWRLQTSWFGGSSGQLIVLRATGYPSLNIVVGQSRRSALQPWYVASAIKSCVLSLLLAVAGLGLSRLIGVRDRFAETLGQVERSEERYRSLFAGAAIPMILVDPADGAIVEANAAACQYYGHDEKRLVRMTLTDIDARPMAVIAAEIAQLMAGQRHHVVIEHRLAGGATRDVDVHAGPIELQGRRLLCAIIHDVTERKRAELEVQAVGRRLQDILAAASEVAIIATDRDGVVTLFNRGAERMLGYDAADVVGRINVSAFHSQAEMQARGRELTRELGYPVDGFRVFTAKAEGDGQERREWTYVRKDGSELIVSLVVTPVRCERGDINGYLGIAQDVTERKSWEMALRSSEERFRGTFEQAAVGIAHVTPDGRYLRVNRRFCDILGYPADALYAMQFRDITHPDEAAREREVFAQVSAGLIEHCALEKRYRHKDGGTIWCNLTLSASRNEDGSIHYLIAVLEDINARKQMENALRVSEENLRLVMESAHMAILIADRRGQYIYANPSALEKLGYPAEELLGMQIGDLVADTDRRRVVPHVDAMRRGERLVEEWTLKAKDGRSIAFELSTQQLPDGRFIAFGQDISARKSAEEKLRLAASVFRDAHEGIAITDANVNIIDANDAFGELTGYSRDEVLGRSPRQLYGQHQNPEFFDQVDRSLNETGYWQGELWHRRGNGESVAQYMTIGAVKNETGAVSHYIALLSDITERKRLQEKIEALAYHDALTRLPNRALLEDRFRQAVARASRQKTMVAVCYVDLDGFKPINDRYGHKAGDKLLIEIARRVQGLMRSEDTAARLGGDEFLLLINDMQSEADLMPALSRVLASIAMPFDIDAEHAVTVSASIGVALYPRHGTDADALMRHADQAMYQAKQSGRNRVCIYQPDLSGEVVWLS